MADELEFTLDDTDITYADVQLAALPQDVHNVVFCVDDGEPLILEKDGFIYKGERVEDAGEAHRLFLDWLRKELR